MLTTLAASFLACTALAQDADDERIRRKLRTIVVTLDLTDTPLAEFAQQVASWTGENVVVTGVEEGSVEPITIKLSGVSLESLARLVLEPKGLVIRVEEGVVHIRKIVDDPLVLELYDVRDLTAPLRNFPGVDISLSGTQLGIDTTVSEAGEDNQGLPIETLMELIQAHVDKDGWDNASISSTGGILVVRQTPTKQAAVSRFIGRLRRLR